ncbi:MAG: hypothetical protein ACRC6O_12570, partial [Flavobacterium sp.]
MSKPILYKTYDKSPKTRQISDNLTAQIAVKIHVAGLLGSGFSFVTRTLFTQTELPFLLVFNNKEEAAYYLNDMEELVGEKDVLFYPASFRRPYQIEETDNANV